jgi:hypothetical protein
MQMLAFLACPTCLVHGLTYRLPPVSPVTDADPFSHVEPVEFILCTHSE